MIKVADFLNPKMGHEEFNAGLLCQIREAYPDSEIVFFAHAFHLDHIRNLIETYIRIDNISFVAIDDYLSNGMNVTVEYIYKWGDEHSPLIITASNERIYSAVASFAREHNNFHIYIEAHGEIECFADDERLSFAKIYTLKPRAVAHTVKCNILEVVNHRKRIEGNRRTKQAIREFCQEKNTHLLMFSQAYLINNLWSFDETIAAKIIYIHLPYINHEITDKNNDDDCIYIGCMPRTLRQKDINAWRIIKYVNKRESKIKKDYCFLLFRYYHPRWGHVKTFYSVDDDISLTGGKPCYRKDIVDFIVKCNFALIPYGEKMYVLSSSGIMADSIQYGTPVLMYQSHCFDEYEDKGIGIRTKSIQEMGDAIIEAINSYSEDTMNLYKQNIQKCKDMLWSENITKLKKLLIEDS